MTSAADQIAKRETDGLAWAIRDILLRSLDDTTPSQAACGLLAHVRAHADAEARQQIDTKGAQAFRQIEGRAALWDALNAASQTLARESLASLATPTATIESRQRGEGAFLATYLPRTAKRLSQGLKSALAAIL